ncbi:MAG: ketol-acid reductoisomerase, partial [Trichococcus flocculiformis]
KAGFPDFHAMRAEQQGHQIEAVGAELRKMMPFVNEQQ